MKLRILLLSLLIAAPALSLVGQVTITAKKVVYTRPKPIAGFKKSFTITYPKVKAATLALSRKIEAALSYEKLFDFKLQEELTEIQWLEDATYDVHYNANGVLSVSLTIEGSGAYSSVATRRIVVNASTGKRVQPVDVFLNTEELLAALVRMKDTEVQKAKEELKSDPDTKNEDFSGFFNDAETYHKVSLSEFEINENGVTFHHNYGFPNVAKAIQPPGEFFMTWQDLKPFIRLDGLLASFKR